MTMGHAHTTTQIANSMKRITKNKFDELCKVMPESYKKDILSVSILKDEFYEIEDKAFLNIHKNIKLPPKTAPTLSLPQQAANLGKALVNWTASGFSPTPPDILAAREATYRACPEWDAAALNGTGRCRKCGCSTWAKLRMATERCPIGKWEAATASHELRVQDNLTSEQAKTLTPKTT